MTNDPANTPPGAAPGQRAGKLMLLIAWIGVLGLLTLVFGDWEETQRNPNRQPVSMQHADGSTEVVLQRNRQGHYVANGTINGTEVTFLLDTGATDVVVPQDVADAAGLRRGVETRANTAAGVVRVWTTRIHDLRLGSIHLQDIPATINPHMHGVGVLLGMSALRQVEFQQRGGELRLRMH